MHWTCPCHPPPTLPRSRCLRQCVVQDPIHPSVRPSIRLSICMSVFVWLSIRFLSLLKSVSMCYCSRSKFYSRRTHSLTPFSRDNTRKRKRVTCTYRLHLWPFNQFILDILTKKNWSEQSMMRFRSIQPISNRCARRVSNHSQTVNFVSKKFSHCVWLQTNRQREFFCLKIVLFWFQLFQLKAGPSFNRRSDLGVLFPFAEDHF